MKSECMNFTGLYFSPLLTVARWRINCQQLPAFTSRHITLLKRMTLLSFLNFVCKNCALILINVQNTSLVILSLSVTAHCRVQDWPRWEPLGTTLTKFFLVCSCKYFSNWIWNLETIIYYERYLLYCKYWNFLFDRINLPQTTNFFWISNYRHLPTDTAMQVANPKKNSIRIKKELTFHHGIK